MEAATARSEAQRRRSPQPAAPRLRILVVVNWDIKKYPLPWATQRIEALRRAGAEVEVLAEECVETRLGFLRLWWRLSRFLDVRRFDVVVPIYGSLLGLMCAMQRRVPAAVSFAGSDLNGTISPDGRLLLRSLPSVAASQLASLLAGGVSVHNRSMRAALLFRSVRERSVVIPDGVDTTRFFPRPRAEARRRLGLPERGTRFLFVAFRADARAGKRLALAREAVALVPGAALDVADKLPFSSMPDAYAAADALIVTSRREGSPNCVKEALACATPVVSVDVGDVREVLEGMSNCAVVDDSPAALARALMRVISDGKGCPEGPIRVAAAHGLAQIAERYLRFYEEAAGPRSAPDIVP